MLEPIALAVHLENMDVMGKPIEESAGQTVVPEHHGPFVERQVRGDDGGATLVPLAEGFEQKFAARGGERHVAEFVDDQQPVGLDLLLKLEQAPFVTGLQQLMDQTGGGGEAHREAALAGSKKIGRASCRERG